MMRASVAMCTYNGARYLPEQLDSLAAQTDLPAELVVCDDRSCDGTADVIEVFAARAPFPVRFSVNERNLGSTKNFERAISLCRGEVIALADQDDVWHPDKLARLTAAFEAAPKAGLVFTDAEIVDENLRPLGRRLWQHAGFGPKEQRLIQEGRAFDLLFDRNVVTGATLAFRAAFKELILPIPGDLALIHDGWIALMISAVAPIIFLPEPLIDYRQHPQQQMGANPHARPRVLSREHYQGHIRQIEAVMQRISQTREVYGRPEWDKRLADMRAHVDHIRARLALPPGKARRVLPVLKELLTRRYHRHSNGFRSVVRDLFY